jgi:tetratricopeptide (TPR) repeat protein
LQTAIYGDESVEVGRILDRMGYALAKLNRNKEALKCLERCLDIYNEHKAENLGSLAKVHLSIGKLYLEDEKSKPALKSFETAQNYVNSHMKEDERDVYEIELNTSKALSRLL